MSTTETKSHAEHLQTTIDQIEKGVENHATTGAATSIGTWIKALATEKSLKPIHDDLVSLKEAISAGKGAEIVRLLEKLGEETTKSAAHAPSADAAKLKALGSGLTHAAKAVKTLVK